VALEADPLDPLVRAYRQLDRELIPAQRVEVMELKVDSLELGLRWAPVSRTLVVLQDVLAVQLVHETKGS
jgi:hypothetical protein